jgi:hypothetical protein
MNPYVERAAVWHDFHESFLPLVREMLTVQVLPRYFVLIDEHRHIHELASDDRRFLGRGDILVPSLRNNDDAAGYAYHIYSGPPEPALSAADAAWARQFLESLPAQGANV